MKKLSIISFCMALIIMLPSCEKYLDVNNDPNRLAQVTTTLQLPANEVGIGFLLGSEFYIYPAMWTQMYAGTANEFAFFDIYSGPDFSTLWNQGYGIIANLQTIQTRAVAKSDFTYLGIAQILKSYLYCAFTDVFDAIPFNDASKGVANLSPVYNPQQEIYHKLLDTLDVAIINLGKGNATEPLTGDLIYNGNVDKWIRAANSLKLKMYLNLKLREPQVASAGINKLILDNMLLVNYANNFNVPFGSSISSQNPIYQFQYVIRPVDAGMSTRFYNAVKDDPRGTYYFRPGGSPASSKTFINGAGALAQDPTSSRLKWGKYVVGDATVGDSPVRMITSSMVNFMLAEAALTIPGVTGGAAASATYFTTALNQHFSDISTYCAAPPDFLTQTQAYTQTVITAYSALSTVNDKLNSMMTEKWKTLSVNSYEAYNDYRRTRMPVLDPISNKQISFPERYGYPLIEQQLNKNFPADYVFLPSSLERKVWWAN